MNRRQFLVPTTAGALASTFAASQFDLGFVRQASAQDGQEPLGGQPPQGSTCSIKDFDYQIKHQRAFEAVLWNMPAIAIYSFRRAAFTDLGMMVERAGRRLFLTMQACGYGSLRSQGRQQAVAVNDLVITASSGRPR